MQVLEFNEKNTRLYRELHTTKAQGIDRNEIRTMCIDFIFFYLFYCFLFGKGHRQIFSAGISVVVYLLTYELLF